MNQQLVDFYLGRAPDAEGRMIDEIWSFSSDELEDRHDFIQWLFPIDTASPVNPAAPVLDAGTAAVFARSAELGRRLGRSLDLMLRFYGFEVWRSADGLVLRQPADFLRGAHWLRPDNHNHLRLTRIVRCLALCGMRQDAEAVLGQLLALARQYPDRVSCRTVHFWRGAVEPT